MLAIMKKITALGLASLLLFVETWLLVDAAGYTITPQVAVIPATTLTLALLPLWVKESTLWLRITIGIACIFLAAFVFQGVIERSGGILDTKVATAQGVSEGRRLLETELTRERLRLAEAESNMQGESRRGGCGSTCKTWQSAAIGIQTRIDDLIAELSSQTPVVADPVSKRVSVMSNGFFSEDAIRNWRPVFQPVGFLIAIWALFGLAFHSRVSTTVATVSSIPETGNGGGRGLHLIQGGKVSNREIEALKKALSGGKPLTNDEVAALMQTTKGEASKRVSEAETLGIVTKRRVGRHVAISLQHAH